MMIGDNRPLQQSVQPVSGSTPDAYEAYWCSTEEDASAGTKPCLFPSADSLQSCRPGEAYNELWQHWDAP